MQIFFSAPLNVVWISPTAVFQRVDEPVGMRPMPMMTAAAVVRAALRRLGRRAMVVAVS